MPHRFWLWLSSSICALSLATAQPLSNRVLTVAPLGKPGAYTGFRISDKDGPLASVYFSSNEAMKAAAVALTGSALRFTRLSATPTPALGADSFFEIRLLGPADPYPEIRFRLSLQRFDQNAWEKRWGRVPFHFLICPLEGAEIFHQRGWMIGTPVIDDYIMMKCEGPGKTIVSDWSRNWTYAPPIGAYPTAVAGLWKPSARLYVGYEFHAARLTDHSERNFGTAYCWENGATKQFVCLTWPYGEGYNRLRYPQTPSTCGTHFRLLWSRTIGPEDDPNRFVHEFLWRTYTELLPASEPLNDLSWLPGTMRLNDFGAPGPLGSLMHNTGPTGETWFQPHVNIIHGVSYFSPIDYYFRTRQEASIRRLGEECRKIVALGQWLEIEGDRCFCWRTPLDGGGAKMFGPGVETIRHVNNWAGAIALLDYVRNDPQGAADILPYVDGLLRFTKHILYTRNCYADVPAAQFAWSATPCVTFCLKYYYHFRNDPARRELAELAYKLARNMTYRYLALWPCDNDNADELDASFLMEPNAGRPWLGSACANEIWVYNVAMLYEYLSTGDPIMGHYLRGMLERYHELYQEQYYPGIQQYPASAFTERLGLFEECAQGRGRRAEYGGLWGGLERLIWPIGTASVHVACGEKAALAFNKNGHHTDIADYRYSGEGNFSFRLVPGGLQADPQALFDVAISFPFFSLLEKPVVVTHDGRAETLGPERVKRFPAEASTIIVQGVRLGDVIAVGAQRDDAPVLPCRLIKPRTKETFSAALNVASRNGFRVIDLTSVADGGIERNWDNVSSLAGYEPGLKEIFGVPFVLLDPELTNNRVCVTERPVPVAGQPRYLFALVGDVTDASCLLLTRDNGVIQAKPLRDSVPVLRGWPPVFSWHIDFIVIDNQGQTIRSITPQRCRLFALTTTNRSDQALAETFAVLKARREAIAAEERLLQPLQALRPLFEKAANHIAVLPTPDLKNPRANWLVRLFDRAGLTPYVRFLTPEDLVNPFVFNRQEIWLAIYLGIEHYYQNINRPGDGDEALQRWLQSGGTLLTLASGPFPFYYNEAGRPVVSAPKFGLPICGSGAGARPDRLQGADVSGWEKPPAERRLMFYVNPAQQIVTGLPATFPFPAKADPRWRPIANVVGPENEYTPLVTLKDETGRSYGDGAALIFYRAGELAGARVAYVWHSLRADGEIQQALVTGLLRYLLEHLSALPPAAGLALPFSDDFSGYAEGATPLRHWFVTAGLWAVEHGTLVGRNSGTDGWTPTGLVAGAPDWTDYRLQLRFQVQQYGSDHRDGAWIGFRYLSPQECYCLAFEARGLVLHKAHAGVNTNDDVRLAQAPGPRDTAWHNLAISIRGKQIDIDLDGRRVIHVEDNNLLDVGPVPRGGICLSARRWSKSQGDTIVAFDDVRVE